MLKQVGETVINPCPQILLAIVELSEAGTMSYRYGIVDPRRSVIAQFDRRKGVYRQDQYHYRESRLLEAHREKLVLYQFDGSKEADHYFCKEICGIYYTPQAPIGSKPILRYKS